MQQGFDAQNVTVFASFLHAHTLGIAMELRHIRNGVELEPIEVNDAYDFDYQQTTAIDPERGVILTADDEIILECFYNSMDRTEITFGGLSTVDEMCQAYVYVK